jgi:hypothetical protein
VESSAIEASEKAEKDSPEKKSESERVTVKKS